MSLRRNWKGYITWIWALVFVSLLIGYRVLHGSRVTFYHQELMREFRLIQPLPNASVTKTIDSYSPWGDRTLVGADYAAPVQYTEVRRHYDNELRSHGWKFVRDEELIAFGGEKTLEALYCKGPLAASFGYTDSKSRSTFALDMSWGLHNCK